MKTCVICKEKIIEEKERYVKLTDFDCGEEVGEAFYHLECWRERFKITNSERKKKMYSDTIKLIKNIKDRTGIGEMPIEV